MLAKIAKLITAYCASGDGVVKQILNSTSCKHRISTRIAENSGDTPALTKWSDKTLPHSSPLHLSDESINAYYQEIFHLPVGYLYTTNSPSTCYRAQPTSCLPDPPPPHRCSRFPCDAITEFIVPFLLSNSILLFPRSIHALPVGPLTT